VTTTKHIRDKYIFKHVM